MDKYLAHELLDELNKHVVDHVERASRIQPAPIPMDLCTKLLDALYLDAATDEPAPQTAPKPAWTPDADDRKRLWRWLERLLRAAKDRDVQASDVDEPLMIRNKHGEYTQVRVSDVSVLTAGDLVDMATFDTYYKRLILGDDTNG